PEHGTTAAGPERGRRAGPLLVAGLLAVVLAAAGLTYALRDHGGGRAGDGTHAGRADGTRSGATGTAADTDTRPDTGAPSPAPSGGAAGEGTTSEGAAGSRPAQSVHVALAGAHTEYVGSCPPPDASAPAFTATFTVGRLPARVEYRWTLAHGSVSDPGWKTLAFPAGGTRSGQVRVTVTAYADGGTTENEIGVEVRAPVRTTSNTVPFSVSCTTATETPSDGASASPSDSP
ncbi:serine/threonine protein kinase, partial [Streptomyces sp. NPDC059168]